MTTVSGVSSFVELGTVWPNATWRHIIVTVDATVLLQEVQSLARQAAKMNLTVMEARLETAHQEVLTIGQFFCQQASPRSQRDMFGVLGIVTGLFNLWEQHCLVAKVDSTRTAVKTVAASMDALSRFNVANQGIFHTLL